MNMIGLFFSTARAVVARRKHPCVHSLCCSSEGRDRIFKALLKCYSQAADKSRKLICYGLPSRTLISIYGHDTSSFLQGIITNDMNLLGEEGQKALYAHMLNVKGRTLYDIIIYSLHEPSESLSSILLECDRSVLPAIMQHLKMYKIRRKVTVDLCPDLSLWALLPLGAGSTPERPELEPATAEKVLMLVEDPRTDLMGWRLVTRSSQNPQDFIAACQQGDSNEYHRHRYKIGLPEGVGDLPPGEALPLESNLVFLNGISFSKGCYIGQELTARTHHTGVVRKHLLPIRLSVPAESLPAGAALQSGGGKPAGKLRAGSGRVGLGLVRMAHANETLEVVSSQEVMATVEPSVPNWWPKSTRSK